MPEEVNLKAVFDCEVGHSTRGSKRFTIGKVGDQISGTLFIRKGIDFFPKKVIITFSNREEGLEDDSR